MKKIKILALSVIMGMNLNAATESINEVMLPQSNFNQKNLINAEISEKESDWNDFRNKYGNWSVLLDKYTGTPVNALGEAVNISEGKPLSNENVEKFTADFLKENADVFNLNFDDLKLTNVKNVRNKWYVSYKQFFNGYEVLLSEVELRLFENGNLMTFRIKTYNDINIDTEPKLTIDEAINSELNNIKSGSIKLLSKNDDLHILPVFNGTGYGYNLVYNYDVRDNSTAETFTTYADANTGDILWRQKTSHNVSSKILTSGIVQKEHPNSPHIHDHFPYQRVDINGVTHFTDENGELETELNKGDIIEAHFEGTYGKVTYQNDEPTVFRDTVDAEGDYNIYFDNNNSRIYDRFGYYHVNLVRHWLKEFDPDITAMDIAVDVVFMDDYMGYEMVNAFSNEYGDTIAFIGYEDEDARLSVSPSVLYHEYGHGINTRVYKEMGSSTGMGNMSLHEALADITSALLLDDPRVGANVFKSDPDRVIRHLQNDYVYPDDISSSSHSNGLILAGAVWDIRNSVSLEFAKENSHFARYGTPDDADIGTAYSEYFVEFLFAADDDGDLSNGTPYFEEILAGFNRHQIGTNLILENSLVHNPLQNTEEYKFPFEVDFRFDTKGIVGTEIDSAFVLYKLNNDESIHRIKATGLTGSGNFNEFAGQIPELENPALVNYKIEYYVPATDEAYFYPDENDDYFTFLAGYASMYKDNLESDHVWTMGADDDNAQGGLFEIAAPKEYILNLMGTEIEMQPGEDYSEFGEQCLITGNDIPQFGGAFSNSLMNGKTSAISPEINLNGHKDLILAFYVWNINLSFSQNTTYGKIITVSVSDDDGNSWTEIASFTPNGKDGWYQEMAYIPAQFDSTVKFKFTGTSTSPNQAVTEILIDDFEILIPSNVTSVTDGEDITIDVYPNPFSDRVTIETDKYDAAIYDMAGNKIYDIPQGISNWNGINNNGDEVQSGVYFIKINTGNNSITRKIIKL